MIMNNDFGGIWEEGVMAYFKVLFQHFPEEIEENHEKFQSGYHISRWVSDRVHPECELDTIIGPFCFNGLVF